jgi:hypothetical protein
VFPDLSAAVLVHDRYQNYDAIPGVLHQLCTQHYADLRVMPTLGRGRLVVA